MKNTKNSVSRETYEIDLKTLGNKIPVFIYFDNRLKNIDSKSKNGKKLLRSVKL